MSTEEYAKEREVLYSKAVKLRVSAKREEGAAAVSAGFKFRDFVFKHELCAKTILKAQAWLEKNKDKEFKFSGIDTVSFREFLRILKFEKDTLSLGARLKIVMKLFKNSKIKKNDTSAETSGEI